MEWARHVHRTATCQRPVEAEVVRQNAEQASSVEADEIHRADLLLGAGEVC
jgi:hypothetical protein